MKIIDRILDAIADRVFVRVEKELAKWKPLAARPPLNNRQERPRYRMIGDEPSEVEWVGSRH
jgi:hypothetical protein